MPLNFPTGPTVGQEYYYNGKWFRWDGVAWKQLNSTKERRINEYTNFYEVPTSNSVNLDVRKYNYFKVNVDENTVITIPTAQSYYKFMLELKSGFTSSAQRWDISTATYDNVSFSVSGQDTNPFGITFKPDGTKMYMVGYTNDRVYQYTLSTPWVVSSATYDSVSFLVSGQDTNPIDITFKPDGTKMYILGYTNDRVYQYSTIDIVSSSLWPSNVIWNYNVSPMLYNGQTLLLEFYTNDGGTTIYGVERYNKEKTE